MAEPCARRGAAELIVAMDPIGRAAERLTRALREVLDENETVRLAIPGGSALDVAARSRSDLAADWRRVALTWVDERCVPLDDAESNRGAAARLGLFAAPATPAPEGQPERLLFLYEDGEAPRRAATRAADDLRESFSNSIDVALLGMGADGHVASLFPPVSRADDRMVAHVANSPKPPSDRVTLTRRALETAGSVILVAIGESKRDALARLVSGDATLPAYGLTGLVVVTDLDLE